MKNRELQYGWVEWFHTSGAVHLTQSTILDMGLPRKAFGLNNNRRYVVCCVRNRKAYFAVLKLVFRISVSL